MDEGLSLVSSVLTFVIILPIVVPFLILNIILKNKKLSFILSIIGFIGTAIIGYAFGFFEYAKQMIGISGPFIVLIISIVLNALIGLIIIKLRRTR